MTTLTHQLILATGTNLGDRAANLARANTLISEKIGQIVRQSAVYETQAWGIIEQPDFLNQALLINTDLSPQEVLQQVNEIEKELGRIRHEKWGARLIDIDIIFYDDWVVETTSLTIPHPFLQDRNFVLIPLLEIAGDWIHPILKLSIEELYLLCNDLQEVVQLETE